MLLISKLCWNKAEYKWQLTSIPNSWLHTDIIIIFYIYYLINGLYEKLCGTKVSPWEFYVAPETLRTDGVGELSRDLNPR